MTRLRKQKKGISDEVQKLVDKWQSRLETYTEAEWKRIDGTGNIEEKNNAAK